MLALKIFSETAQWWYMSNSEKLLCKNLSLSIWLEAAPEWELIKIRLVDKLAMKKVEVTAEPGMNTPNRAYHRKEAITIAMRRLVDQAVTDGLISVSLGTSPILPPASRPGGIAGITLSIPPDA